MTPVTYRIGRAQRHLVGVVVGVSLMASNVLAADAVRELELQVGETRGLAPGVF